MVSKRLKIKKDVFKFSWSKVGLAILLFLIIPSLFVRKYCIDCAFYLMGGLLDFRLLVQSLWITILDFSINPLFLLFVLNFLVKIILLYIISGFIIRKFSEN